MNRTHKHHLDFRSNVFKTRRPGLLLTSPCVCYLRSTIFFVSVLSPAVRRQK